MTPSSELTEAIDGRTARAVRTREAIVDACIDLVNAGDLRPTAPRIAERAGVSVRSIFQHFDDLETLFGAVGERVVARLGQVIVPIDADAPLSERLDAFVEQRATVNESLTPIRRAAFIHASNSEVVREQFSAGHRFLRAEVEAVFAAELAMCGVGRDAVLDTLVIAASWSAWDLLRSLEGRSVTATADALRQVVAEALSRGAAARPGDLPGDGRPGSR